MGEYWYFSYLPSLHLRCIRNKFWSKFFVNLMFFKPWEYWYIIHWTYLRLTRILLQGSMHWIVSNNLRNVILVTIYYSGRHVNCQTNITNKLRQITVCSKNVSCRPWHIARRLRYLICCEMITDDVWFVLLRVISF